MYAVKLVIKDCRILYTGVTEDTTWPRTGVIDTEDTEWSNNYNRVSPRSV